MDTEPGGFDGARPPGGTGFGDCFRAGFSAAVRTWQVLLVQLVAGVFYGLGFVVLVLLPLLLIGMSAAGMDAANLEALAAAGPEEVIGFLLEHIAAVVVVAGAFILYLTAVMTAALFLLGGELGVLRRAALRPDYRFTLKSFMADARRLFWPIMWLGLVVGLAGIGVLLLLGGLAAAGVAVIQPLAADGGTAGRALGIFALLAGMSLLIVTLFFLAAWSTWSFVVLAARETKAMDAAREAARFVFSGPRPALYYLGLAALYLVVLTGVSVLLFVLGLIPILGILILIPGQIAYFALNRFLVLWLLGGLFHLYLQERGPAPGDAPGRLSPGSGPA